MKELDFLKNIFFLKMGKIAAKPKVLWMYENLVIIFFLNLVYNGSLY